MIYIHAAIAVNRQAAEGIEVELSAEDLAGCECIDALLDARVLGPLREKIKEQIREADLEDLPF